MSDATPTLPKISPTLASINPELISAHELNQWADQNDAKQTFPELMRRLLSQTPGITNLNIRAHEGTSAPGWDGIADSTGSAFLPAGKLRFEFGTNKKPKSKAENDYNKRAEGDNEAGEHVFIFATPRNWAGAHKWAEEHIDDGFFADVKAIDSHVLEGWLQATLPVHYWISERLGRRPQEVRSLQNWWSSFGERLSIDLPASFYAAGRKSRSDKLIELLTTNPSEITPVVKSSCVDESLAFIHATLLNTPELLEQAMVITNSDAWRQLVTSPNKMLLIPQFNNPELHTALSSGHRVLLAVGPESRTRHNDGVIELPKIGRTEAVEIFENVGIDRDRAERMAPLARRSMSAFFRSVSRNPSFAEPEWVRDSRKADILAPLVLVGSWEDSKDDKQLIEEFTGCSFNEIEHLLKDLHRRPDGPFIQSAGQWRLTNPAEAAELLLPELDSDVLERWKKFILDVLLIDDPFTGMTPAEHLTAHLQGVKPRCSGTLRKSVAEGLALAANASVLPNMRRFEGCVDNIVAQLFDEACQDASGNKLTRLSASFRLLAEASPNVFLDTLEEKLLTPQVVTKTPFHDTAEADGPFNNSSLHVGLLWALETLCWSPDHYGRAIAIIGRLAILAPDDKALNQSLDCLQRVTVGWSASGAISIDDKIAAIRQTIEESSLVGWALLMKLWPPYSVTIILPSVPKYRDWDTSSYDISLDEMIRYVAALGDLTCSLAGRSVDKWREIIERIGDTTADERTKVISSLRDVISQASWYEDERHSVWRALSDLIDKHAKHPQATWAMPEAAVLELQELADQLSSNTDPRRFSRLFSDLPMIDGLTYGDEGFSEKAEAERQDAVTSIVTQGIDAVTVLVEDVDQPNLVGDYLAQVDDVSRSDILTWLDSESSHLQRAADAYARKKVWDIGVEWVLAVLNEKILSNKAQERLMATVPIGKAYWDEIGVLEPHLVAAYWRQGNGYQVGYADRAEAGRLFLEHDCPWQAVAVAMAILHGKQQLDTEFAKQALAAAAVSEYSYNPGPCIEYSVSKLLKWLESEVPNDPELPVLEFYFFDFLHDYGPSNALYRALGNSPTDFVQLTMSACGCDGDDAQHSDISAEQEKSYSHRTWKILNSWHILPGLQQDGTIDGELLRDWVMRSRELFVQSDCADFGDCQIGQVLACSPDGEDGVWPAMTVRDVIEDLANTGLRSGICMGVVNRRGASVRRAYDGGDQERDLEKKYSRMACKLASRWPQTAAVLRELAKYFEDQAIDFDKQAERMADEG